MGRGNRLFQKGRIVGVNFPFPSFIVWGEKDASVLEKHCSDRETRGKE